jgi:hypothetical protein
MFSILRLTLGKCPSRWPTARFVSCRKKQHAEGMDRETIAWGGVSVARQPMANNLYWINEPHRDFFPQNLLRLEEFLKQQNTKRAAAVRTVAGRMRRQALP